MTKKIRLACIDSFPRTAQWRPAPRGRRRSKRPGSRPATRCAPTLRHQTLPVPRAAPKTRRKMARRRRTAAPTVPAPPLQRAQRERRRRGRAATPPRARSGCARSSSATGDSACGVTQGRPASLNAHVSGGAVPKSIGARGGRTVRPRPRLRRLRARRGCWVGRWRRGRGVWTRPCLGIQRIVQIPPPPR